MSRVLVTGATGFIGQHLCEELVRVGHRVRGTHRGEQPATGGLEWCRIDNVGEKTDWSEALDQVDFVVHLAGLAHKTDQSDEELREAFFATNVLGTRRLAVQAKQFPSIARLLCISSIAAALPPAPGEPGVEYARSKLLAEQCLEKELSGGQPDYCVLRPCLVYGPGNPGNMARLIRLVGLGIPLPFGAIRNRRSLLYVGNLTSAISACLTHPAASRRTFNVSDREAISTPELLMAIGDGMNRKVRLISFPLRWMRTIAAAGDWVTRVTGMSLGLNTYSLDKLCASLVVDGSELAATIGWVQPFSTSEGLKRIFQ